MKTKLKPEFTFAGFTFPRYVVTLPVGTMAQRLADSKRPRVTGGYYHAPRPNDLRKERGFYLDDAGQCFRGWQWCDDVSRSIRNTGWYCDEYCDGKIRGIVCRLSHGRFIAGWSMGEHMASMVDYSEVFTDENECARRADALAESAAECEREYQSAESARMVEEEREIELSEGG